ncbi:MAG: hypothetical protein QXW10_02785 [Candidatus Micrarchaeaceae archaeon]
MDKAANKAYPIGLELVSNEKTIEGIEKLGIPSSMYGSTGQKLVFDDHVRVFSNDGVLVFPILLKEGELVLGPAYRKEPAGLLLYREASKWLVMAREDAQRSLDSMSKEERKRIINQKLSKAEGYISEMLRHASGAVEQ